MYATGGLMCDDLCIYNPARGADDMQRITWGWCDDPGL